MFHGQEWEYLLLTFVFVCGLAWDLALSVGFLASLKVCDLD